MGSWGLIYNHSRNALKTHLGTLARLQEQVTTGARVIRASDGPATARRIMFLQSQQGQLTNYTKNIDALQTILAEADNALQSVSGILTDVHGKLTQAATGTLSPTQRAGMAEGINQALESALSLANHRSLGRYIFGGTTSGTPPYEAVREGGQIVGVTYRGDYGDMPMPLSAGLEQSGLMVGERVFRNQQRQAPVFEGATGAAAGAGTSNVRGDVWLKVANNGTSFGGAIGLASGTGSAGDTIVGTHQLTVNADARTLTLDDGQAVSYAPGATNVAVANAAGQLVHVDVSGLLMGGGSQTVQVTGSAKLSIDGGLTWTATDLSDASLQVTDSRDGRFLYVDTRQLTQAGLEPVRVPGTYDLFGALASIRDLIDNRQGLPLQQQLDLLNKAVASLDEVSGCLGQQLVVVGSRLQAGEALRTNIETLVDDVDAEIANQQDVDVADLTVELARTQTLYEMTLAATSKLLSLSLLDFLR